MKEESFGVIPVAYQEGAWHLFLIQHMRSKYWGFPKGHREGDEKPLDAALRELFEETALRCKRLIIQEPFIEEYQFMKRGVMIDKKVYYYLAEVIGTPCLQTEEIRDGKWVTLEKGLSMVTHDESRLILFSVARHLSDV
jgi:8-oxo-dGTP pyrophosphatase MutT (NUDIX family)